MMDRAFKGVWVPKEIWLDRELTLLDKAIMIEIDSLDRSDVGCWASNEHFASMFGCTSRKVSDSVSKLIKCGYVRVIGYDGRKRYLRSCLKVVFADGGSPFQSDTNEFSSQTNEIFYSDSRDFLHSNTDRETENKTNKVIHMDGFDRFWKEYPNKVKKSVAFQKWQTMNLEKIADVIVEDVKQRAKTEWTGEGEAYVPHPTTYLNQRRWEDETRPKERRQSYGIAPTVNPSLDYDQRKTDESYYDHVFDNFYGSGDGG